jgi:hypothetical protein
VAAGIAFGLPTASLGIPPAVVVGMDELDAVARTEIQPGWHVLDADGTPIGTVERVHDTAFAVRVAGPVETTIDVGFDEIESADDGRVELAVSSDDLATRTSGTA